MLEHPPTLTLDRSISMTIYNKSYGFIYLWYDTIKRKYYVGCHWGTEDDGYICSSSWMKNAYNNRPQDFKRRIVSRIYTNKSDMFIEEQRWLCMIKPEKLKSRYYNLNITWQHWQIDSNKEKSVKEKISEKVKEAMQRPEVRGKYLKGLETRDNRSSNPEVIEKRRQSMKKTMAEKFPVENRQVRIKFNSQEYKDVMADIVSDRWKQVGYKEKVGANISKALKGKPHPHIGVPKSDETRNKISESKLQLDKYKDDIIATMGMKATVVADMLGISRHTVKRYRQLCT